MNFLIKKNITLKMDMNLNHLFKFYLVLIILDFIFFPLVNNNFNYIFLVINIIIVFFIIIFNYIKYIF